MNKSINILIIQNKIKEGDFEYNVRNIKKLIKKAMINNNKKNIIICLSEYCWTGYIMKTYKKYILCGNIIRNIVKKFCKKYNCYIQPGTYIVEDNKNYYNCAEIFDNNGNIVCSYYKQNLWLPWEKFLTSGLKSKTKICSVNIYDIKISLLICYDSYFEKMYKKLDKNVKIVIVPHLDHYLQKNIRKKDIKKYSFLSKKYNKYIVNVEGCGVGCGMSSITSNKGILVYKSINKENYKFIKLNLI